MNDEHEEDYAGAREAVVGADRMAEGLSCIPHPVKGDLEWVRKFKARIAELERLQACQDVAINAMPREQISTFMEWQYKAMNSGLPNDQLYTLWKNA